MPTDSPVTSSEAVTRGLRIAVRACYSAEHSKPEVGRWFFVYTIRLSNEGSEKLQLLSRHWLINDGTGSTEEVRGPGVVGEQPELAPGKAYEYMSGCPMPTDWGTMEGHFVMQREDGETFEAQVGRFFLASNTRLLASRP